MLKKKWLILGCLLLVIVGVVSFVLIRKAKWEVILNDVEFNVMQEVLVTDVIKDVKNGELVSDGVVDTSVVGEKEFNVVVKDFYGRKHDYPVRINIVDKEEPVIVALEIIETEEGKEIDLLKDVSVEDNSKEELQVVVDGTYDFNKAGEYNIYYIAKDSSGNEARREALLKVKEKRVVVKAPVTPSVVTSDNKNNVVSNTTFTTSKGFSGVVRNGVTYIDGVLVVNKTYSLPESYGGGLTQETKNAFNKMQSAATLEGLNIYLSSGFRSYATQNKLYNNYVKRDGRDKADTYSARPGNSEHQSGLAFDVNQINDTFNDSAEAVWLSNNCYKYGFILRYPKGKTNETGYKYESWHFRYVGVDLASKLYNNGDWITLESYFGITSVYS